MSISTAHDLFRINVSGDPYDVGRQLGRFGAWPVKEYLTASRVWAETIAFSEAGQVVGMRDLVRQRFPGYWRELQGLADGLDLPIAQVFAWNCRGDIHAMAPDGCTTIQVPGKRHIIAHNEDGDPAFRGHCALARIEPTDGTGFTAFVYPGSLPGHSFAQTDAGLVQTVNNIRPDRMGQGVPRMILTRAVLDCQNLDEALALLQTSKRAGAFHVTLAAANDARMFGIEFTAGSCSVHDVTIPAAHANHLIHKETSGIGQTITDSSASRQDRADALLQAQGKTTDPLTILRDKAGPGLPIRRDEADDPDQENTLATVIFTIEGGEVEGHVFDRPTGSARFHIRQGTITTI